MAAYNKHDVFIQDEMHGFRDFTATTGDEISAYLSDTLPTAGNSVLADITAPVTANLDSMVFPTASRTSGQTGGTYTLILPNLTLTASGAVAQFQYAGIYNSGTASAVGPLICWYDYGTPINMTVGETFTYNFINGSTFTAT